MANTNMTMVQQALKGHLPGVTIDPLNTAALALKGRLPGVPAAYYDPPDGLAAFRGSTGTPAPSAAFKAQIAALQSAGQDSQARALLQQAAAGQAVRAAMANASTSSFPAQPWSASVPAPPSPSLAPPAKGPLDPVPITNLSPVPGAMDAG